jgi:hypothetical protein
MGPVRDSNPSLQLLSQLLLSPPDSPGLDLPGRVSRSSIEYPSGTYDLVSQLRQPDLEELKALAVMNHVVVRAFEPLHRILEESERPQPALWVCNVLNEEKARLGHALQFLEQICSVLKDGGCPAIVIKSLDHLPDLGSDLDLYTDADSGKLVELMKLHFNASTAERSWGDRLANKWNFIIPGLPELVEVHVGRLGQTGEQTAVTRSLTDRSQRTVVSGCTFRVAAPEDRIVISTLQRMYRHFYIRLCDIVDNARLLNADLVDFSRLHALGLAAGLWEGIATYLLIVSEFVDEYCGHGLDLPAFVVATAKFGTDEVYFRRQFLRVPILPHSLNLYASELRSLLLKGQLKNSLRLSLLPGLATAAAIELKFTGSDKGIW